MKSIIIWDKISCDPLKVNRQALPATCFQAGIFLDFFFDHEDSCDMLLGKVN